MRVRRGRRESVVREREEQKTVRILKFPRLLIQGRWKEDKALGSEMVKRWEEKVKR
jgi:hypothetical protein